MTSAATSLSRGPAHVWSRVRGVLLALALLAVAGFVLALVRAGEQHGRLDPRSPDRDGSRAIAELLKERGVSVRVATTLDEVTAAAGPDSTVLVTAPDVLSDAQRTVLRDTVGASGGRTVLLAADTPSLRTLAPGVTADLPGTIRPLQPGCDLPEARRAGSVSLGGVRYVTAASAGACYLHDGLPTLVRLENPAGGDTILLGAADPLFNEHLAAEGNASLALQLLGSRSHLLWYLPSLTDPSAADGDGSDADRAEGEADFLSLIPSGWLWGTLQLFVAAALAAVWRARRLGPLVVERLPVAIRASEATEGRARLYFRANARDRAAAVLRSAARDRLAPLAGVPSREAHSPDALLPALSARLTGRTDALRDLLFGPAPSDDAALVLLADQLDALEREVRTS
ncbi:DUF4350 domain-containing protein [Streptomyces somaliensis]|uniref:DUF4350 domain-containing protein n=1 Tax=Streptomyces somaliensis TaxID=78355 RepID=UPI0020CC60E1|nr:DUF4350 domain-containing protein [Streptomyces somaliensis]MCP9945646.1 DUF4350 domain-containing protein [Streptomyces somaliensis]MCP9961175.1 DUF4350 domain-containing protein [Streptomyces somaliensis]MCP9973969.1 DUF4350 domain-containing protein [Streptomyces somaliensis]